MRILHWILKKFFDYRYLYLFNRPSLNPLKMDVKIGISTNYKRRLTQVKESSNNKRIDVLAAHRVLNARKLESYFRKVYIKTQFNYKGSGRTEWHKLTNPEVSFLKARLRTTSFAHHVYIFVGTCVAILILCCVFYYFYNARVNLNTK